MLSDQGIMQWDKRLTDQARRGWDNYKHLHIDLGVARIDQSYLMAGEYLYVEQSSSTDAIAKIKLNRKSNDALDLEKGVEIETVFIEVFVTNDALEDEWLDLVFGINFKYKKKIVEAVVGGGLPKTGQTTSYQDGDDGFYEAGLNHNFVIQTIVGDDVVIDEATGLMWARDGLAAGGNNGAPITWANALIYAEGLNFAGFDDWRLPNINELLSLVNYAVGMPALYVEFINIAYAGGDLYWSSTTYEGDILRAWGVMFQTGQNTGATLKTATRYILCVRGCI